MAWELGWLWLGLEVMRVMRLHGGIVCCGLVRIMKIFFLVLFFYDRSMCVKLMVVIISQCLHNLLFCAECSQVIAVSVGPYSCALYRIWRVYADCGLFDMM